MGSTLQLKTNYFPLYIIYFSIVLTTSVQFQKYCKFPCEARSALRLLHKNVHLPIHNSLLNNQGLAYSCWPKDGKSILSIHKKYQHPMYLKAIKRHRNGERHNTSLLALGIPKVAYRLPGSSSADWIDIYNRLYRERIIFMSQEIDHDFANQIISILLYLDCEDSSKPIHLYINSPGGSIVSGMAIFDTMKHIRSEIITINIGMAASMASFILAAGTKGKRFALPHSRIMIHQPIGGAEGQAEDIRIEANQILKIKNQMVDLYSRMTGLPKNKIIKDIDRDKFMSATEAKDQGFIDHIIQFKDKFSPSSV